jgi:hypothetical protein
MTSTISRTCRSLPNAFYRVCVIPTAAWVIAVAALSPGRVRPPVTTQPNPAAVTPIAPPAQNNGGEVHGSIFALIRGEKSFPAALAFGGLEIMLPDVTVHLENVATAAQSPPATTDLFGTFRISAQPQAEYRLCWRARGFAAGCDQKSFVLRSTNVTLFPVGIFAEPRTIHGTVTLKDGQACRFVAGFLGADTETKVTALLPNGRSETVRVNNYNDYVLAGLPNGNIKTTATCEKAEVSKVVALAGASVANNLTLPNSGPSVGIFTASAGGRVVRAVAAGTTVRASIEATGNGGFPLHYRWATDPPVAGFVSQDTASIDVKIPGPGLSSIYVLVHDDHGGNAMRKISLSTRPDRILFSGHVKGNDAPFLAGASVTLNGVVTHASPEGNFALALPKEEPRYVLTIEKIGYQMVSKVFYAPVVGGTYELYRAQEVSIDPRSPVKYVERPRPVKGRERAGVEIVVEADSLAKIDADGTVTLATGPAFMHGASYDLHDGNNPLPGDFAALDKQGNAFRMETFGAADISITDAAGAHLNLAPGKAGLVRMPIDPGQQATAPGTMPVWHFDATKGVWIQDGVAIRNGTFYEAKVTHFSAVNMDLNFGDGACTRIVVDQSVMPTPFKIRMTPLTGTPVDNNHQDQIVDGPLSVVVREPPNTNIRYDMVDSLGNIISAATQTVHTNASSPSGTMWDPPPNPPYADCMSEVRYNLQTASGLFPTSSAKDFLTYQTPPNYLSGATADGLTDDYYHRIDPGGTKTAPGDVNDFAHWKTADGFDRPGETTTKYANNYDLGFGRDMHMQTGGQLNTCPSCIAYYVSNYPSVEDAVGNPGSLIATVAMEYSPQNGISGTPYTKFYVFAANGAILRAADLDGNGPKNVPALCVICHNGNVTSMGPDGSMPFARFIPFDVDSFGYHPTNVSFQRPAVEPAFKELNRGVLTKTNASAPVRSLVTQWYGAEGDTSLTGNFNGSVVPSGWTAPPPDQSALYNAVVKPSCRACHTTRDPSDTGQNISWHTFDSLNQDSFFVRALACNPSNHLHVVMPHAKRTFARFWLSTQPNGPVALGNSNMLGFQGANNSCPQ